MFYLLYMYIEQHIVLQFCSTILFSGLRVPSWSAIMKQKHSRSQEQDELSHSCSPKTVCQPFIFHFPLEQSNTRVTSSRVQTNQMEKWSCIQSSKMSSSCVLKKNKDVVICVMMLGLLGKEAQIQTNLSTVYLNECKQVDHVHIVSKE